MRYQNRHWFWPLWYCLSPESQYALKRALSINHHKKLIQPGEPVDLLPFNAEKEMQRVPESENHMRVT